ncbi:hypothetical protein [Mycobacterium branderi]|uniref:Secreted protein n=1 Tax=Mycobacterium branderi TaxID=43348 RepID=A0A7I7WDK3_9MYCO|nr:hypothetical protein [Mycobacterium branderi]MCV7231602.1 hypothetical protein [Mycobacterium branderi]ORA40405.1 hypothetical protein BST20_07720 [Mycobacterium branderi]BBZ14915.1 hypothetical protein MBRA_51100 [Mycobacterium branderi]
MGIGVRSAVRGLVVVSAALQLLVTPWPRAAAGPPALPDFDAYPRAQDKDYLVRDTPAYWVHGFQTPDGLFCTSSSHRTSYLDCYGPFPSAPGGANYIALSNFAPPVPKVITLGPREFEGHPLAQLPVGLTYRFDGSECVRGGQWELACVMLTDDGGYSSGFAVTEGRTEIF